MNRLNSNENNFMSSDLLYYLAQFFLTAFYWQSGIDKSIHFNAAIHEMGVIHGLPFPALFAIATITLQLIGPLVLMFGKRWAIWVAIIFIGFTIVTLFIAHPFWQFINDATRFKIELVKTTQHITYIGGFILSAIAAHLKYPIKDSY